MSPSSLWLLFLASWALLNFWWLPLTQDRWKASDTRAKLARAGSLVVLEKLRDLTAIGAVVMSLVLLLVMLADGSATTSAVLPQAVLLAAASLYKETQAFASAYGDVLKYLGLVGAIGTLYLSARHARAQVAAAWAEQAQRTFERLREDPETIEAARTDPELAPSVERFDLAVVDWQRAKDQGSAPPDEENLNAAAACAHQCLQALAVEMAKKDLDLASALKASAPEEQAEALSGWKRALRALGSKRLADDLKLAKKPLGYVVTALLYLSLMGWSAEPLADSLRLATNNLQVNLFKQEAQQQLDQAISRAQEPPPAAANTDRPGDTPTPQQLGRLIGRTAVQELARAPAFEKIAGGKARPGAQAELVRAAIAEHAPLADAQSSLADRLRKEASEQALPQAASSQPSKAAEQALAEELTPQLERLQKERPAFYRRWAQAVEARYAAPRSVLDAQTQLLDHMVDSVFGAVDTEAEGEMAKQGKKLAKDFGSKASKTYVEAYAKTFLTEALTESARPEVLHRMASRFELQASSSTRELLSELRQPSTALWQAHGAAGREAEMARAVASKVADLHENNPALRRAIQESLGGYDSLFPSHTATEAEIPGVSGGGGGGAPGKGRAAHGQQAHFAQARATNFHVASRSFRVRGVLIGQDHVLKDFKPLDLRWSWLGSTAKPKQRLRLELRLPEKQWQDLGSFEPGVLNQALRYAADRRVVATTITPGDGKIVGRITYLHPALIDTPLGCRIIEADRLVDTFSFAAKTSAEQSPIKELVADRRSLSQWLRWVSLSDTVSQQSSSQACPQAEVQQVLQGFNWSGLKFSASLQQALDAFIREAEQRQPGSAGLLRMSSVCREESDISKASACLCKVAGSFKPKASYWFPEDHTSQFRERAEDMGANLAWFRPSRDHLGHSEFWVHTTFALRHRDQEGSDEESARTLDATATQRLALNRLIADRLPDYVRDRLRTPSYADFMAPIEDFIRLQRLFRPVLNGQADANFPVHKLVELERISRSSVPVQPTTRWEPVGQAQKLMATLADADPKALITYKSWLTDQDRRAQMGLPLCDAASR